MLSLAASAGVIFFGVLQGILAAVALSILLFFKRSWWPHGEVLGEIEGRTGWHSVDDPGAEDEVRRRRVPLGGAAVLRQLGHVPPAGPASRPAGPSAVDRPRMRGGHRHRRHRRRDASSNSTSSSTRPASISLSSSYGAGCENCSSATGSSARSIATTSTTPSRRRSPPSTQRTIRPAAESSPAAACPSGGPPAGRGRPARGRAAPPAMAGRAPRERRRWLRATAGSGARGDES